jgi:hypothetical protein
MQPMPKKLSSNGFSVVEVVVALLVVAALGLGGFFVRQHNKPKANINQSAGNSGSDLQPPKADNQYKASDPSEGGKYLVIKEWGVRFPVPKDLEGKLEYALSNNVEVGETAIENGQIVYGDRISFTSSTLASMPGSNCRLESNGGRADLFRSSMRAFEFNDEFGKMVDGIFYWSMHGNGGTCSANSTGEQEGMFIEQMMDTLRNVEKIKS